MENIFALWRPRIGKSRKKKKFTSKATEIKFYKTLKLNFAFCRPCVPYSTTAYFPSNKNCNCARCSPIYQSPILIGRSIINRYEKRKLYYRAAKLIFWLFFWKQFFLLSCICQVSKLRNISLHYFISRLRLSVKKVLFI